MATVEMDIASPVCVVAVVAMDTAASVGAVALVAMDTASLVGAAAPAVMEGVCTAGDFLGSDTTTSLTRSDKKRWNSGIF